MRRVVISLLAVLVGSFIFILVGMVGELVRGRDEYSAKVLFIGLRTTYACLPICLASRAASFFRVITLWFFASDSVEISSVALVETGSRPEIYPNGEDQITATESEKTPDEPTWNWCASSSLR